MRATADDSTLTAVLKRDRLVVIAALVTVIVLAWAYILTGAGVGMSGFEAGTTTAAPAGTGSIDRDMVDTDSGEGASDAMQDMGMAAMAPMA